jgi:hypothetical protein
MPKITGHQLLTDPSQPGAFNIGFTPSSDVKSTGVQIDDGAVRYEQQGPYSVFGDTGGKTVFSKLPSGPHTIQLTPWTEKDGKGTKGDTYTVNVIVISTTTPAAQKNRIKLTAEGGTYVSQDGKPVTGELFFQPE